MAEGSKIFSFATSLTASNKELKNNRYKLVLFGEGTAWSEDYTEAQMNDPHLGLRGRLRSRLPFAAQIGQESGSGAGVLIEQFVAAVPIEAGGRCYKQRARRLRQARQGRSQHPCGLDTALPQLALVGRGPAMCGYAGPREMDRRVQPFYSVCVRNGNRGRGVPFELPGCDRIAPDQLQNLNVARIKRLSQSCTDYSGSSGQEYLRRTTFCAGSVDSVFPREYNNPAARDNSSVAWEYLLIGQHLAQMSIQLLSVEYGGING